MGIAALIDSMHVSVCVWGWFCGCSYVGGNGDFHACVYMLSLQQSFMCTIFFSEF